VLNLTSLINFSRFCGFFFSEFLNSILIILNYHSIFVVEMIYSAEEYARRALLKRRSRRSRFKILSKRLKELRELIAKEKKKKKRKRKGKKDWENSNMWRELQDPDINNPTSMAGKFFRRLHRVPYPVFVDLVDKCKKHNLFGTNENHGNCIPVEIKLMAVLRFLARGHDSATIKSSSLIGESTVHGIIKKFLHTFVERYESDWLQRRPTLEELHHIMETYRKLGFPGAIGSVDCTHVDWNKCPYSMANSCRGKEGSTTVVFEVVVDHRRRIWSCSKGFVGSFCDQNVSDADTFMEDVRLRRIYNDIEYEVYDVKGVLRKVKGVYLICDNGYKKEPHLICPYVYRSLTEQIYFSEYLESVRKDVECTFGILKNRFRVLGGIEYHDFEFVETIFKAACILHNMILDFDHDAVEDWENVNWEKINPMDENMDSYSPEDDDSDEDTEMAADQVDLAERRSTPSELIFRMTSFESKREILVNHFKKQYEQGAVQWPRSSDKETKIFLKSAGEMACHRAANEVEQRQLATRSPESKVYVDHSSVQSTNAERSDKSIGNGLFATRDLKANETIVAFTLQGTILSTEDYNTQKQKGRGGYALRMNESTVYDCYEQAVRWKSCHG